MHGQRYFAKRSSSVPSSDNEDSNSDTSIDRSPKKIQEEASSQLTIKHHDTLDTIEPNIKQRQKDYRKNDNALLESSKNDYTNSIESESEIIKIADNADNPTEFDSENEDEDDSDDNNRESTTEDSDTSSSESSDEELLISHAFVHKSKRRSNKEAVVGKTTSFKKQKLESTENLQKENLTNLKDRALKYIEKQHKKDIEIKLTNDKQRQFMQEDIGNIDDTDDVDPEFEKSQWIERELMRQKVFKQSQLEKAQSVIDRQSINLQNISS